MYDIDQSSDGGPKGSYEIFKAEGDQLLKQGEYKKAIESYNTALELRPQDKNCLVARSQCYLQLGDAKAALADADTTLQEEPKFVKGLCQKADALYQMGEFETALVFYHRGNKLRPELQPFRLGIQKCQEAIENCIGDGSGVKLDKKGDLSFFDAQEEKKSKKQGGYSKPQQKGDDRKDRRKQRKNNMDSKTCKQLLGELYADKEYLEKLLQETESSERDTDTNQAIADLALEGLDYLDTRSEFWQQQKPMYSRKRDKNMRDGARSRAGTGRRDPTEYVLKNLEKIDEAQSDGRYDDSLKLAKKTLKEVEKWSDDDIPNRAEVVGNLHSSIGNAYLEKGDCGQALEHHKQDLEIAEQHDLEDAKSRAMDNLGRVYARMGKYDKAIEVWEKKIDLCKSPLEKTWLMHELGRCYLEKGEYDKSKDYGEQSLAAANEADDDVWKLNASVLIAQSEVKLGDLQAALDAFERSLEMAKLQKDAAAESAIKKAVNDVNNKIAKKVKEGDEAEGTGDEKEPDYSFGMSKKDEKEDEKKEEPKKEVKEEPKQEPKEEKKEEKEKDDTEQEQYEDDFEKDKQLDKQTALMLDNVVEKQATREKTSDMLNKVADKYEEENAKEEEQQKAD